MKIGILGGTFDPVHKGHLVIAEEARASLGLSEIILVPVGQPPLKADRIILPAEERLEMLRLAVAGRPHFIISTVEIERTGPSYTVDTLTELSKQYGMEDEVYFIMGWDNLTQLVEWKEPTGIIRMCYLAAVPRPGYQRPDLKSLEDVIPGITKRVVFLAGPHIDISASAIRDLAARGKSINHLVPEAVAEYIKEHKLYTN